MRHRQIIELLTRLQQQNPQPTTELNYSTPFELLVAVVLSAQATDISVNKATTKLYLVANTPIAILELGVEGLKPYIQSIGLYPTKARHIIKICERLIAEHDSQVPQSRAALEALPGVGRKTANVVLNTAFGRSTIAVDTHVFRVCNRTHLAPGKTVSQVERKLLALIPEPFKRHCHHWLILHGRYTCTARKPCCHRCILADLCIFKQKGVVPHKNVSGWSPPTATI